MWSGSQSPLARPQSEGWNGSNWLLDFLESLNCTNWFWEIQTQLVPSIFNIDRNFAFWHLIQLCTLIFNLRKRFKTLQLKVVQAPLSNFVKYVEFQIEAGLTLNTLTHFYMPMRDEYPRRKFWYRLRPWDPLKIEYDM